MPSVFRFLVCVALAVAAPTAPAQDLGMRLLQADEPVTGTRVPAVVVYPAAPGADTSSKPRSDDVDARIDAPIAAGRHALIVLSHGHGGDMYGHHDLAEALARHGYVVVAPEHVGDSWRDQSGFGSDRVLLGRAWQASAVLSAVLADATLAAHVDPARIGAAGFSAGGYTTLLLLGARPDFSLFATFCRAHPDTAQICDGPPAKRFTTIDHPPPMRDARIRAGFAMAPLSLIFDQAGLRDVHAPVFLYAAERDQVLLPDYNARAIKPWLPNLVAYREVPGAGHFVFLAPCSPGLLKKLPDICIDAPGIDRVAVHRQVAEDAIAFFDAQLQ